MSHDIPHPLAGRTGQWPPFAPKDWKWKASRWLSDMYFCSPQGARLRSQIQLHEYLATLTDPPSPSEFVWRVHPDEFKGGGPLLGILDTTNKRKPDDANGPAKKKRKKKIAQKIFQKTGLSQKVQVDKSVPPLVSSSRLAYEGNHHLSKNHW